MTIARSTGDARELESLRWPMIYVLRRRSIRPSHRKEPQ
jgi:hypothetical protein